MPCMRITSFVSQRLNFITQSIIRAGELFIQYFYIPLELRKDFIQSITYDNFKRTRISSILLALYSIFLVIADIQLENIYSEISGYDLFFYMDVSIFIIMLVIVAFTILYNPSSRNETGRIHSVIVLFFSLILLSWTALISALELPQTDSIPTYLIGVFIVASIIYIRFYYIIFLYIISFIIFICGMVYLGNSFFDFITKHLSSVGMLFFAFIISRILFRAKIKDFISKREIDRKNIMLTEARDSLEEKIQKRTRELQESNKEKEVLIKEIHHRVKNNMQVVSSLLNLAKNNIDDMYFRSIFDDSQKRIGTMAMIHEMLYNSSSLSQVNFATFISRLVNELYMSSKLDNSFKIELELQPVHLTIEKAVPCGLMVNELVSNVIKYAFQDNHELNTLKIKLEERNRGNVTLLIQDNGVGLPRNMEPGNSVTLGLHLVYNLIKQLDAELEIVSEPGTLFIITFNKYGKI